MRNDLTLHNALTYARRLDQAHRKEEAVALLLSSLASHTPQRAGALVHEVVFLLVELYNAVWKPRHLLEELLTQWELTDTPRGRCELAWADYRTTGTTDAHELETLLQAASQAGAHTYLRTILLAGKVLTEQAALESARSWLLRGMTAAREQLNDEMLAAFAGALGEVFYLGDDVRTALELFDLDARLLAPGSRDVERLAIYRAHCYRQLSENDAARTLYSIARMRSELRGELSPYALRGLLWCAVIDGDISSARSWLEALRTTDDKHSLALGLLAVASTLPANERASHLNEAAELLEQEGYWRELAWVRKSPFPNPIFGGKILNTPVQAHELNACDRALLQVDLRKMSDVYDTSLKAFEQAASPTEWMGAFF